MGGSLRLTAGYCNVIGLRPSAGRVPVYPAADGYAGLSVQGPMARTVDDVALLLSVMAGPDRRSPISLEEPARRSPTSPPAVWPDAGSPFHRPRRPDRDRGRDRRHGRVGGRGVRDRRRAGRRCLPRFRRRRRVFPDSAGLAVRGHPGSLDEHSALVRASLYENMLQGRTLTGPQVGRAAVLRPALVQRMREFLEFYDALILPVAPVRAFDAESSTRRGRRAATAGLSRPDGRGLSRHRHRPFGDQHAGRVHRRRHALGVQFVGRHRGERDLLGLARVRIGHDLRVDTPTSELTSTV